VQTTSSEGVLFYGRQQYPVYSHLAVSLSNATLHVSVVFAQPASFNELYVTLGNALDDDRCPLTTFWLVRLISSDGFDYEVCPRVTFRSAGGASKMSKLFVC